METDDDDDGGEARSIGTRKGRSGVTCDTRVTAITSIEREARPSTYIQQFAPVST